MPWLLARCREDSSIHRAWLPTDGCLGEAGILRNGEGKPFMARVAPATKGLASREVACRDLTVEITKAAELAQTRTTSFCTWTTSLL